MKLSFLMHKYLASTLALTLLILSGLASATNPLIVYSCNVLHQWPLENHAQHAQVKQALTTTLRDGDRQQNFLHYLEMMIAPIEDSSHPADILCFQEIKPWWLVGIADERHEHAKRIKEFIKQHYYVFMNSTIALLIRKSCVMPRTKVSAKFVAIENSSGTLLKEYPSTDRWFRGRDTAVRNGALIASFTHTSGKNITAMSVHVPFIGKAPITMTPERLLTNLQTSFGKIIQPILDTGSEIIIAGDFNMETNPLETLHIGLSHSSFTQMSARSIVTARSVLDGNALLIDHLLSSLPIIGCIAQPADNSELIPHGVNDTAPWKQSSWMSDHKAILCAVDLNGATDVTTVASTANEPTGRKRPRE